MNLKFAVLVCLISVVPSATTEAFQSVLFVRGADRSGGFLEADNDAERTEQLADITNNSIVEGNHGWGELEASLRIAGFNVSQVVESVEAGAPETGQTQGVPVDFTTSMLSNFDVVVFGSNNAVYTTSQVDAVEDYIRNGGGAIFISDANFGSDWADASNSDQQFLDRFGLIMHQDQGTYSLTESDFNVPSHPIFSGVEAFDGEGVTPIEIGVLTPGVSATILANAEGNTRLNEPPFNSVNRGPSVPSDNNDAALMVAEAGQGRIIGHFDRNTFFNDNGAGTNINRLSNRQFAVNLFTFAATSPTAPEPLLGDVNLDEVVNFLDIVPFISALSGGGFQAEADIDQNESVDFLDISPFIAILSGS